MASRPSRADYSPAARAQRAEVEAQVADALEEAGFFRIKQPPTLNKDDIFDAIHFDKTWVDIMR